MLIQKAKDAVRDNAAKTKILIYGDSGAGKTWLAAGSLRPLVVLTEPNGFTSAMHSNGEALIVECPDPKTLREVVVAAKDGKIEGHEFDTIVFDSLTEIQQMFKNEILEKSGKSRFTLQMWGDLADSMRGFIRVIRDIPLHVVCICLQESELDEADGMRHIKPMFQGKKTANEVNQYFNAVGCIYKELSDEGLLRKIMFEGPSRVHCKSTFPIPQVITNPNMAKIQTAIMTGVYQEEVILKEQPKQKTKKSKSKEK
jgi:hypothetical protein|tara:strand:- start:14174 stop:14941 length:768 start_codon:yes stop_codon:yes gene_type:complete